MAVSPLIRSATANPAIWLPVAAPSMISFMAHAASSAVSDSPLTSAPITAGQVILASTTGRSGQGPGPHQAGQFPGQLARIDRMAGHRVRPGPGSQPSIIGPPGDEQDRRTVVD